MSFKIELLFSRANNTLFGNVYCSPYHKYSNTQYRHRNRKWSILWARPTVNNTIVVFRSSFSSDTSSSRPDLGIPSRKSSYSQGPPRVVINGEQQSVIRRKSDDEPAPATLPRIVEVKKVRRSSDGQRPPAKNRKTVEVFRWLRQAPKTELEAMSKMSEEEIKNCIIQALEDQDPTWLLLVGGDEAEDDENGVRRTQCNNGATRSSPMTMGV